MTFIKFWCSIFTISFFKPNFSLVEFIFLKLQSARSTASSVNNSFREFREYIEDIKVTEIPFEIQETASEVISKILVELEKRFENVERSFSGTSNI